MGFLGDATLDLNNRFNEETYNILKNRITFFNSSYMNFKISDIELAVRDIILFGGVTLFGKIKLAQYQDNNTSSSFTFTRIRKINGISFDKFTDLNQYFALPAEKITWEGRLNKVGESLLYASHNSFAAPIFETSAQVGDDILLIIYKRKPGEVINLQKMAVDDEQINKLDNYISKINDMKLNFIKFWLTKHGDKENEPYIYRITNTIKDIYTYKKANLIIDGFIYPSTTKRKQDFNVAFNQIGTSKLVVDNAVIGKIIKIENNKFWLKSKRKFIGVDENEVNWVSSEEQTNCFIVNEKSR